MNVIELFKSKVSSDREHLEDVLDCLSQIGKPRVARLQQGWFCVVELNTTLAGVAGEVRSDFGHVSPMAAAYETRERARALFAQHHFVKL